MGWNTTVVVNNDSLDAIRRDSKFGENLYDACMRIISSDRPIDVCANPDGTQAYYANAATVIETHHADSTVLVAVGGNYGIHLGLYYTPGLEDKDTRLLKQFADNLGYRIIKKR